MLGQDIDYEKEITSEKPVTQTLSKFLTDLKKYGTNISWEV